MLARLTRAAATEPPPLRVPLRRLVAPEQGDWRTGSGGRGLRMSQRRRRRGRRGRRGGGRRRRGDGAVAGGRARALHHQACHVISDLRLK